MIYRVLIEGSYGPNYRSKSDYMYLFYSAMTDNESRKKRDRIFDELACNEKHYEITGYYSELELEKRSSEKEFIDSHLLETGSWDNEIRYTTLKESLVYLTGEHRERVLTAFEESDKLRNERLLQRCDW